MRIKNAELFRGDCLEVLKQISDAAIQAVITDPPFGSTDCSWDKRVDLEAWWQQIERVTTLNAVIAIFSAQPFTTAVINSRPKLFRYDLVWDKVRPVGFLNANRQPLRVHEQVLIFCKRPGGSIYEPQKTVGKPYNQKAKAGTKTPIYRQFKRVDTVNDGTRHPTSILRFDKPGAGRIHPTEKPIALLRWLVNSYTRCGMTVLDSFMGSGVTGEASLRSGRKFIGIERDENFFDLASARLAAIPEEHGE